MRGNIAVGSCWPKDHLQVQRQLYETIVRWSFCVADKRLI